MTSETIKTFKPLELELHNDPFSFLEKLFTHFLQSWFAHSNFRDTGMHWVGNQGDDADETTEMVITGEKPNLQTLEKVPHLVVVLGSATWAVLGLDQLQKLSMKTGQRQHTDLVPMTVAYHCQAKIGSLARRIAWYAAYGTIMFRRLIMKHGGLHQLSPALNLGSETGPSAYTGSLASEEVTSVVVTVPFFWQPQWRIRDPAPVLAAIDVALNVLPGRVDPLIAKRLPAYKVPAHQFTTPATAVLTQHVEVSEE